MKKELAIVFGVTDNMAFALGNVFLGLKKHCQNLKADIIVFEQGLKNKDKRILNSIFPCKFIEYRFPHQGHLTNKTLKQFSELTFSRYECFDLLNHYKNVLWLDIDILIKKDITPLLEYSSTGISLTTGDTSSTDFTIEVDGLRTGDTKYNAGVMYLQDNLPNHKQLKDWCYQKTVKMAKFLKCADQGIINLMIKEFGLDVHFFPKEYNFNPGFINDKRLKKAAILHTFCQEKFWNYWIESEWDENYKEWRRLGGSKYSGHLWMRKFKKFPHPLRQTRKFLKFLFHDKQYE